MPDKSPPDAGCICRILRNPANTKEYRRYVNSACRVSHAGKPDKTMTES